jgi:ABC-type lipoprotein export system ATPase subunit
MTALRHRRPRHLSQGEKQRVAIIRAVANDADLLLADEPTASLESQQGMRVIELLRDMAHTEGRCVIVATHDRRLAQFADHIYHLQDGRLIEAGGRRAKSRGVAA